MNYTLQLHGERTLYPVPSGLYELVSDITREVLRDQPSLLYQYIARYLDTLVRVREYARTASILVNGVTQENTELLSYVSSIGVPYELAVLAARKIQRAFRAYRAKHSIKLAVQDQLKEQSITESYQELLEAYDLDPDTADRASEVIQKAYKTYQSKKALQERKGSKDASTHTIESISLTPLGKEVGLSREKKPPKRDSKLLVYQQTPKDSVLSTWSTLAREIAEKESPSSLETARGSKFNLVYEQTDISSLTSRRKDGSECSVVSENMESLPSYYDESQPKIPMISESGLLVSDERSEIVTLFSTDSVDESQRITSGTVINLPNLTDLTPTSKPEDLAKELFDVISHKTSSISKSQPLKSLSGPLSDDLATTGKEPSGVVKGLSTDSVSKRASKRSF